MRPCLAAISETPPVSASKKLSRSASVVSLVHTYNHEGEPVTKMVLAADQDGKTDDLSGILKVTSKQANVLLIPGARTMSVH